jgi:hypothetical protein
VVLGYVEKLNQKDPQQSFAAWRGSETTRRDIATLLARLQKSRQELRTEGMTDPATALVVSPLAMVEHSLLNILQYRPAEIVATLKQIYVPWLNAILDEKNPASAAAYTNNATTRLAAFTKKAADNPLGKMLDMKPGSHMLTCVGLNDLTPAHQEPTGMQDCVGENPTFFHDQFHSNRVIPIEYSPDRFGVSTTAPFKVRQICVNIMRDVGTRVGPKDRITQDFTLAEKEFVSDKGQKSGLSLLELTMGEERRGVAGSPDIPSDNECGERTRYAFGLSAMIAAETANQSINEAVQHYG